MPSTLVTTTTLLASLALIVASISSLYLIDHYSKTIETWFPAGEKIWYGPPGNARDRITHHGSTDYFVISLIYDWSTEKFLGTSAVFCIFAGVTSLAGLWMKKRKSTFWRTLPVGSASLALVVSCISIIYVHVKRAVLLHSWCSTQNGRNVRSSFRVTCSRELVSCDLLVTGYLTDHNYADNKRLCHESRASRFLLIPFIVLSAMLVLVYGVRIWKHKRAYAAISNSEDYSDQNSDVLEEEKIHDERGWAIEDVHGDATPRASSSSA